MFRCNDGDVLIALNLFIFFAVTGNNNGHSNICNTPGGRGLWAYPIPLGGIGSRKFWIHKGGVAIQKLGEVVLPLYGFSALKSW